MIFNEQAATLPGPSRFLIVLISIISLIACSSPSSESGDIENYSPMSTGDRWTYRVSYSDSLSDTPLNEVLVKVGGTRNVGGTEATILKSTDLNSGMPGSEVTFVKAGGTLQQKFDPAEVPLPAYVTAITSLRFPLREGDVYPAQDWNNVDFGRDSDGDGKNETLNIHAVTSVLASENVLTHAGNFEDAIPVFTIFWKTIIYSRDNSKFEYTTSVKEWHAKNIGIVKKIVLGGPYFSTLVYSLNGYHVAGKSSDDEAPTITQALPITGVTVAPDSSVSLKFSELMDPDSVNDETFNVVDADLNKVSGSIYASTQQAIFVPTIPLRSGRYTVTVSDSAGDALGNKLPATSSWTFEVDADAPEILVVSPLNGSERVALDGSITIDLSEAPDPASISGSVTLSGFDTWEVETILADKTITLRPRRQLDLGTTYTVTIGTNVRDLLGNRMPAPSTFSFTTRPPLFLAPVTINTGPTPEAIAIADLNGDGRNDVVMTSSFSTGFSNPHQFLIFHQEEDGTLNGPMRYDTTCSALSVAVGDVTGDSSNDIVLSGENCGIEIFSRNSAGVWGRYQLLPEEHSYLVRIGRLNKGNSLDIVGIDHITNKLIIWPQQIAGGYHTSISIGIYQGSHNDIAIGDINGDGRSDIALLNTEYSTSVGVMLQSAGGDFLTQTFYSAGTDFVRGISIGDVNNDNRNDLVAGTYDGISILYQRANGHLDSPQRDKAYMSSIRSMEIADMNNDNRNDIVAIDEFSDVLGVYQQNELNTLLSAEHYPLPREVYGTPYNLNNLALGDINSDGLNDVVIASKRNGLIILYNSGLR